MEESQDRMSETSLTIDPPEVDNREEEEAKWMQLHRQQFSSQSLGQTNKRQVEQDAELIHYPSRNGSALQQASHRRRRHQHLHVGAFAFRHHGRRPSHRRRIFPDIGSDSDSDSENPSDAALAGYDYRAR